MTSLSSSSFSLSKSQLLSGSSLLQSDRSFSFYKTKPVKYKTPFTVQASVNRKRPSGASIFVGGFVLGGLTVGTLGCIFAPQITAALTGEHRKDLMRKLPKFIYDEEKELERTRKILTEKIAQLNMAIDEVSAQIHGDDNHSNGVAVKSGRIEASTNKQ